MDGDYAAVSGTFETEMSVKGSRFIGIVRRCPDADSVRTVLSDISARYPNATHYCYAAVYGGCSRTERFSDNGEPSGTAGRPMISVLRGSGLSDTICVVVRYFGGTLLGTGGLVQAYTDCASAAIGGCNRSRMVMCRMFRADVPYGLYDRFLSSVRNVLVGPAECTYDDRVHVTVHVRESDTETLERIASDVSGGTLSMEDSGRVYREIPL